MQKIRCLVLIYIFAASFFGIKAGEISYNNFFGKSSMGYAQDTSSNVILQGEVNSIFNEPVDSVRVQATIEEYTSFTYTDYDGLFRINFPDDFKNSNSPVLVTFYRNDYRDFDTTILFEKRKIITEISVNLTPKYKILLKGRIFVGNSPVEDVDVTVEHLGETMKLKTLGCYYDNEDYWNCLYLGMFKTDIVTENPQDTIYLSFSKFGYEPQTHKLRFADYTGELLKYRIKYADSIPDLPANNLNLKLAYPFGKNPGWIIGVSYYHNMSYGKLKRLATGLEFSLITMKYSTNLQTLPGLAEKTFDTTYMNFFVGPSLLFYLTKPYIRRFSTYIGSTFSLSMNEGEFVYQPFVGTRFFLDMRKSFNIELRYLSYHLDIKEYSFNYLGNAVPVTKSYFDERFMINLGLQINF